MIFSAYAIFQLSSLNSLSFYLIQNFHLQVEQINQLSFIYLIADALFLLPAGMLLDKYSIKLVFPTAIFVVVLGLLVQFLASTSEALYVGRFITGIGHSFAFLIGFRIAKLCLSTKRQSLGISLIITSGMIGGMLAQTPLVSLINTYSIRNILLINMISGVALFLTTVVTLSFSRLQLQDIDNSLCKNPNIRSTLSNKYNYLIGLLTGLLGAPLVIIGMTSGNLYLTTIMGFSRLQASYISSLVFFATIIGMLTYGFLNDYWNNTKQNLLLSSIVCVTISIGISIFTTYSIVLILFFLLAFFAGAQALGFLLVYCYNKTENHNSAMAITNVIIMVSTALVPITSSYFMLSSLLYYLIALLTISTAICLYLKYSINR